MLKIFLTHAPHTLDHYYGKPALARLRALGEVTLNPLSRALTTEELIRFAQAHSIIVSSRETAAPAEVFDRLPNLAVFSRVAVDIRNIDVDAASRHGVLVTHASPGFDTSVAEWVIGVMVDLARGVSRSATAYWAGRSPEIAMGRELRGATLGIIGYGFIGQRLAALAKAFGMQISVYDPYATVSDTAVTQTSFDAVLAVAEYVVCLAPATPETVGLFNAAALSRMRRDAFFINASRGELLDEEALRDALDQDLIAGAALDVGRAPDQMPSPWLARHPKLIATPHIGGLTPPASAHQAMDTVGQVAALLRGETPMGAVNADYATRLAHIANTPRVDVNVESDTNE